MECEITKDDSIGHEQLSEGSLSATKTVHFSTETCKIIPDVNQETPSPNDVEPTVCEIPTQILSSNEQLESPMDSDEYISNGMSMSIKHGCRQILYLCV